MAEEDERKKLKDQLNVRRAHRDETTKNEYKQTYNHQMSKTESNSKSINNNIVSKIANGFSPKSTNITSITKTKSWRNIKLK
jgi:hypothetical protein